ncbi:VanZ family protein [Rhodohalobacter halophilus]|uniref:VanZ family protein n=1 Tax=Rhodohalobacter halophilus TaxID=1812810 RepID=UPI00083F56CD|nr:VanZ family protein [Rhodohalobacter halophilus]
MIKKILSFLFEHRRIIYTLFFLITAAILALTILPSRHLGQNRLFQYDKVGHFMMFFSWTLVFGLLYLSKKPARTNLGVIFFTGALFGIAIEVLQGVLPFGRSIDFYDAIADLMGAATATFILFLVKKYLPAKN